MVMGEVLPASFLSDSNPDYLFPDYSKNNSSPGSKVDEENRIYCKLKDKPAVYEISSFCWEVISRITSPDKED